MPRAWIVRIGTSMARACARVVFANADSVGYGASFSGIELNERNRAKTVFHAQRASSGPVRLARKPELADGAHGIPLSKISRSSGPAAPKAGHPGAGLSLARAYLVRNLAAARCSRPLIPRYSAWAHACVLRGNHSSALPIGRVWLARACDSCRVSGGHCKIVDDALLPYCCKPPG